jgi:hypothetical protein
MVLPFKVKPMLMYAAVALWLKVGLAIVRTDLCCLRITGYVCTAPMTTQEVLPGLLALHLLAEAGSSACRFSGVGVWLGRGSDLGCAWIHTRLTELDRVFQRGQDKTKPKTILGTLSR